MKRRMGRAAALAAVLALLLAGGGAQAAGALPDGEYAVEVSLSGGSGKASIETPTLLTAENGRYYARITWSSANYNYMRVQGQQYDNQSEQGANSSFVIPVAALDADLPVVANTLAMGAPREIEYVLHFDADSVGAKSSLPQEGAKRVLLMAAGIIVGGGILNHWVKSRQKKDYTGKR